MKYTSPYFKNLCSFVHAFTYLSNYSIHIFLKNQQHKNICQDLTKCQVLKHKINETDTPFYFLVIRYYLRQHVNEKLLTHGQPSSWKPWLGLEPRPRLNPCLQKVEHSGETN